MSQLPSGFHFIDEEVGPGRIDFRIAENEAEIHAIFDAHADRVQRLSCGWCGAHHRTTREAALRWFHAHPCTEIPAPVLERQRAA